MWKMRYDSARVFHPIESWSKLSSANVNAFDGTVERFKSSTALRRFQPMSLRVACSASSWYTHDEQTSSRRRSGNIFTGSIVQALVTRTDGLEGGCDHIRALEMPRSHMDSIRWRFAFHFGSC
jgi:hypothetical protein